MDTLGAALFILFLIGVAIFWGGQKVSEQELYTKCLSKNEIVMKDVRFSCKPKAILIQGKEVPYQ